MPIVTSEEPITLREIAQLEAAVESNPKSLTYRLLQEFHRIRRVANEICLDRESALVMDGSDARQDSIWQRARSIVGPRS